MSQPSAPTTASRPLLLAWCLWLLLSWIVNYGLDAPARLTPETLAITVRGMLLSVMVGLGLVWPAWRLSLGSGASGGSQIATDWVSLLLVSQIVIVGLMLIGGWTAAQFLLVNATLTVWSMAAGLCVWWGLRLGTPTSRTLAMGACLLLLSGGWLWGAWTGDPAGAAWSPAHQLWALAAPQPSLDEVGEAALQTPGSRLIAVGAIAVSVWAWMLCRPRSGSAYSGAEPDRLDT